MIFAVLNTPRFHFEHAASREILPGNALLKFRHVLWGREGVEPSSSLEQKDIDDRYYFALLRVNRMTAQINRLAGKVLVKPLPWTKESEDYGIVALATEWDVLRVEEADIESCKLINELLTADETYKKNFSNRSRVEEIESLLGPHLWMLRRVEDYCPLMLQDASGEDIPASQHRFVYSRGRVWGCNIPLNEQNWGALINEKLGVPVQEGNTNGDTHSCNRSISVEVRREVWRRDRGRCAGCGSQERLEFDHIIPIAMGGSNTARNVQLLCETCNRQKGATLG